MAVAAPRLVVDHSGQNRQTASGEQDARRGRKDERAGVFHGLLLTELFVFVLAGVAMNVVYPS